MKRPGGGQGTGRDREGQEGTGSGSAEGCRRVQRGVVGLSQECRVSSRVSRGRGDAFTVDWGGATGGGRMKEECVGVLYYEARSGGSCDDKGEGEGVGDAEAEVAMGSIS